MLESRPLSRIVFLFYNTALVPWQSVCNSLRPFPLLMEDEGGPKLLYDYCSSLRSTTSSEVVTLKFEIGFHAMHIQFVSGSLCQRAVGLMIKPRIIPASEKYEVLTKAAYVRKILVN